MHIFLDCTETYRSVHNTGIQRVVRNLVNETLRMDLPSHVTCQPVIRYRNSWRAVGEISNPAVKRKRRLCDQLPYRWGAEAICRTIPAARLRKWLLPPHGHRGLFHLPYSVGRRIRRLGYRWLPQVEPTAGDLMISLDLGMKRDWQEADRLIQSGVTLGGVLYDLEPIDHPQFFSDKLVGRYTDWLKEAAGRYDMLLTISETVRNRFLEYVAQQRIFTRLNAARVTAFRLGSTLDGIAPESNAPTGIRPALLNSIDHSAPTFLTVGTIEPRKNHTLLLDAFDRAWAAGANVRCLIAGVIGWKCDEVIRRIETHAELGKRLFVFHDLTDTELAHAYAHSHAFVYPTHAEGFGLPVVEAQRMGLPVIASDLPILRETSAGCATFFRNDSPGELAQLLIDFAAGSREFAVSSPTGEAAISWQTSAERFIQQAIQMTASQPARPAVQGPLAA